MIQAITVVNPKGEQLRLELRNPAPAGLAIKDIDGLGPGSANIIARDFSTADGSVFSSARIADRNVVLTVIMLDHPSVEFNRQKTYRFFPLKKEIKLKIETDLRVVEIVGRVEKNEPDIFSKRETAQISILCLDPYFYALQEEATAFSGVRPVFEFPFSNESLTEKLLEFGELRFDTRTTLSYKGDVDTGIHISIHALGLVEDIALYNNDTLERILIDTKKIKTLTGRAFDYGDDIIISTKNGAKTARLLRDGAYTNIISSLNKDADWFQLSAGENTFSFTAKTGENRLVVTFAYRNAYGGI